MRRVGNRGRVVVIAAAVVLILGATVVGVSRLVRGSQQTSLGATARAGAPLSVRYHRHRGRLTSLDVTVNPSFADASIRLEVLYIRAGQGGASSATPREAVVYRKRVVATNTSSGYGDSTWSGTLSPRDWRGGCRSGRYWIYAESHGPHTSLTDATYSNSESDTSRRFRCG